MYVHDNRQQTTATRQPQASRSHSIVSLPLHSIRYKILNAVVHFGYFDSSVHSTLNHLAHSDPIRPDKTQTTLHIGTTPRTRYDTILWPNSALTLTLEELKPYPSEACSWILDPGSWLSSTPIASVLSPSFFS